MECRRLSSKRYRTNHPDKRREHNRRYLRDNPDKAAQFLATYAERRAELRRLAALPLPVVFEPYWLGEPDDDAVLADLAARSAGNRHEDSSLAGIISEAEIDAYLAASP